MENGAGTLTLCGALLSQPCGERKTEEAIQKTRPEEMDWNHLRQNEISGATGQGSPGVEMVLHEGGEVEGKSFPRSY